jgi:hypothetical protein
LPARGGSAYAVDVRSLLVIAIAATLLGIIPLLAPAATRAQVSARASGYEGVSPGTGNPPPAAARLERRRGRRARAAILTWPGFQPMESGASRFFVQTTGPVTTSLRVTGERVEVIFRNTGIHLSNSARWLETRHFNTPVLRARLERRGRDMVLVMQLRRAGQGAATSGAPRISDVPGEGGTGFHFTYVDFEAGSWLPPEPEPALAATPGGSVGIVSAGPGPSESGSTESPPRSLESWEGDDDERPPVQGPNP